MRRPASAAPATIAGMSQPLRSYAPFSLRLPMLPIDFVSGSKNLIDAALPSIAPTLVAITYKRRTYGPMVLESIGVPLSSPIDALGRFVQLSLPVAFSTLTAMDRFDWMALMNRGTSA